MLPAQIGLPRIRPLFGSLFDTLIAIAAVAAAVRAWRFASPPPRARAVFYPVNAEPPKRRRVAHYYNPLRTSRSKPRSGGL